MKLKSRLIITLLVIFSSYFLVCFLVVLFEKHQESSFLLIPSLGLGVLLFVVFSFLISRWVLKPMKQLEKSLEEKSSESIQKMMQRKDEFGVLARLADSSINQNLRLKQEINRQLRSLLDNLPFMAWFKNREGVYVAANEPFAEKCGYPVDEIPGKNDRDIWPREKAEAYISGDEEIIVSGKRKMVEYQNGSGDKETWLETNISPIFDEQGKVSGTVGISRDITARKLYEKKVAEYLEKMEWSYWEMKTTQERLKHEMEEREKVQKALTESEKKFYTIANAAPVFLWLADAEGNFTFFNEAWIQFTGRNFATEAGKGWLSGVMPEDVAPVEKTLAAGFSKKEPFTVEFRLKAADGNYIWVQSRGVPLMQVGQGLDGYIGACYDIDQLRIAQDIMIDFNDKLQNKLNEKLFELENKDKVLIMQSRQAAMGEMIGNIAHQWRQPLNAIGMVIQNIRDAFDYGKLNSEYMSKVERRAIEIIEHMSQTIDDFRGFFKIDKEISEFSIRRVIDKTLYIIDAGFSAHAIIARVTGNEIPPVKGYPNEYGQVLINILNNAKDAIVNRGIKTPKIFIELSSRNGKSLVSIIDNGGGIPEEVMPKLFSPYFTTKEKGTGIGLSMSRMIMEKMGGSLSFRNTTLDGEPGACFEIWL